MKFKDHVDGQMSELEKQWVDPKLSERLKKLLQGIDEYCKRLGYPPVVVTCLHREGDSGQHGRWKAADIRAHNGYYTAEQVSDLAQFARKNFPRKNFVRSEIDEIALQALPVLFHGDGDGFHGHCSVDE